MTIQAIKMILSILFLCLINLNTGKSQVNTDFRNSHIKVYKKTNSDTAVDKKELQQENISIILGELFEDYLVIKNSLSNNDSVAAQRQALELLELIQSKSDSIDKDNAPRNWEIFLKYAPQARSRIEESTSLTEQRFFFGVISNYIIDLLKTYGMKNKTVYILHCKDKSILGAGKWLSDFHDGKNPFLGPGNESCIEVIETKMH